MATVLIIDDEQNIRKTIREILEDENHVVITADEGDAGMRMFREDCPDVVLLDIQMPGRDGMALLSEIKQSRIDTEVVMISGHGTIELAVQAIKAGAYHFLQKPLSMIEVKQIVQHAALAKQQRDELSTLRERDGARYRMVGQSAVIQKLIEEINRVAPTPGRVLIRGESGTGKELVAYAIHSRSPRVQNPFVKVNCAAIPQNLIESELFGHEKGSFTGAIAQKKGKFEVAHGGTLFLDEIGDMDPATQTKVLRVIQEGEFERVGGTRTIKVDVRIVAATHRNLEEMLSDGRFREDLFYRLAVVPLRVPSLSERVEDIGALAQFFLETFCGENGTALQIFTPEALRFLASVQYPGNIRQLRNIVERAAIMTTSRELGIDYVKSLVEPSRAQLRDDLFTTPRTLALAKDELEKAFVETQLKLHDWDISATAELLGIERTNLHRKIRQLGIEKP